MADEPHYFIGIPIPSEVSEVLADWQNEVEPFVKYKKWVHMDDFHVTIKFLGAVSSSQVRQVEELMKDLKDYSPFELALNGINFFGKEDQPRVMYGLIEKEENLLSIKNLMETKLKKLGFEEDKRRFRPHVTLAKKWEKDKLQLSLEALNQKLDQTSSSFKVNCINLYRVHPERERKYEVVKTYPI
ncbi:RNA 2',3'-cyclic phosphodiesterase [Halalkalibacillus sediminis]|uniref:RNA 2',3'-cyclic phosphodiesterase n=1 Tax=Halalkalibacillus sediminis TaxID=2018042 RepID=A0A2I0QYC2_9BACI|nr:RNA 2',3'-cyclic phosphodiesterase [Halalkalibacillus sediminis]PKR79336.1 RNA 2',3'-cyclic phosphodiesterase [Halalkalibacillus sediminis]